MHNIVFNHREIEYYGKKHLKQLELQPVLLNAPETGWNKNSPYMEEYELDYGVETLFLYELFVGFEKGSLNEDSYLEEELDGVYNFLKKINRLAVEAAEGTVSFIQKEDNGQRAKLVYDLYTPILKKHGRAYVAVLMEKCNEIAECAREGKCSLDIWKDYLKMLSLVAPLHAQHAWQESGITEEFFSQNFPKIDQEFATKGEIEIPVQLKEKTKGRILLRRDATEEEAKEVAKEMLLSQKILTEQEFLAARFVYVPGKIVNVII